MAHLQFGLVCLTQERTSIEVEGIFCLMIRAMTSIILIDMVKARASANPQIVTLGVVMIIIISILGFTMMGGS